MFRILIIDDTKAVHAFVRSLLSKVPEIQVVDVYNGAEAVAKLQTDPNFDLILLDWEMPVLDGPSTFKKFLQMDLTVPTIMMTTKNNPDDIGKMLGMGVAEYLMKPFTVDILIEKIDFATGKTLTYAA